MVKKEGKIPVNARVYIDYTGKKPKIKFGYTGKNPKKDAIRQTGSVWICLFIWVVIGFFPFCYIVCLGENIVPYPEECGNITFDKFFSNTTIIYESTQTSYTTNISYKAIYGFNITCDNKIYEIKFHNIDTREYSPFFSSRNFKKSSLIFIIGGLYWMLISVIISMWLNRQVTKQLIKSERYCKWFPKAQAEGYLFKRRVKKYRKFKPKDVLDNVIVIPKFSNIELEYKTKGDFNKYLKKIIIREYRMNKIKRGKVGKEKVDNFTWYTIFTFTQTPKDGYLEVIYQ